MVLNDSWNRIAQRNYNVLLKPDKQKRGAGTVRRERVDVRPSCRAESSSCTEPTRTFTIPSVAVLQLNHSG